ncbi:14392_t:CDS:2, partial [Acaulospora morrowiae]
MLKSTPTNSSTEWIKTLIEDGELKLIDSSEFEIDQVCYSIGSFSLIELHRWKTKNIKVVLKHTAELLDSEQDTHESLIRELKVYKEIYKVKENVVHDPNEETSNVKRKGFDNILRFYGISYFEGVEKDYKLVLEYANKGDLRQYMKRNGAMMDWIEKINIVCQILNGLFFLHSNEILHRDLHTENILVQQSETEEIRILIADYGFSKVLSRGSLSISQIMFGKNVENRKNDDYRSSINEEELDDLIDRLIRLKNSPDKTSLKDVHLVLKSTQDNNEE